MVYSHKDESLMVVLSTSWSWSLYRAEY